MGLYRYKPPHSSGPLSLCVSNTGCEFHVTPVQTVCVCFFGGTPAPEHMYVNHTTSQSLILFMLHMGVSFYLCYYSLM